jgi:hypothetical protein
MRYLVSRETLICSKCDSAIELDKIEVTECTGARLTTQG